MNDDPGRSFTWPIVFAAVAMTAIGVFVAYLDGSLRHKREKNSGQRVR